MPSDPPRRRRLRVGLVVLLLLAIVAGAVYVFQVGRTRTDPYGQALALRRRGEDAAAEEKLRSLLRAQPKDDRARLLLVDILTDSGRAEEADALVRPWLQSPSTEALGLRTLSQVALARLRFTEALRLARMVADRDPVFSQTMIMHVQDLLGTPGSLERSAQAAETLAVLAEAPEAQAQTWLYAAETLASLVRATADPSERAALLRRSELDRTKARDALRGTRLWKERYPEGKALMARIELLAEDADAQRAAAADLAAYLEDAPEDPRARLALLRHLVATGQDEEARRQGRALLAAPTLFFVRGVAALAAGGQRREALALLEEKTPVPEGMVALVRARLLAAGEGAEREQGLAAFERLAREHPEDADLVRECHRRILLAGEPERAARLLESVGVLDPGARFEALLETTVAALATGDGRQGEAWIGRLAAEVDRGRLVATFQRLWRLPGRGEGAADAFLRQVLAGGRLPACDVRLLRATLLLARPGSDAAGLSRREQAHAELQAIRADPGAGRESLASAAVLAIVAGQPRLLGGLLGRALLSEEDGGKPVDLYLRTLASNDAAGREEAAEGMREVASQAGTFGPWLVTLADALALAQATGLRIPAARWAPSREAPQPTDGLLQLGLAMQAGDLAEAEAYARAFLAAWPDQAGGLERLGGILLEAGKFEELLALHADATPSPAQRLQRIAALQGLDRVPEAIDEARTLLRETDGSDAALLVLGRLLRTVDPAGAIAAIAPLAGQAPAERLRAVLLEERGDEDSAAQVYEDLVRTSGYRDLGAWQQLGRLRGAQGRVPEFVRQVTAVIDSPPPGMNAAQLAMLVQFRGQSREQMQDYERALEDYQRVIGVLPEHPGALNNAAWIMATHIAWREAERPRRLAEALELANRAVKAAPKAAPAFHTRARILEALAERERALADLQEAVRLVEQDLAATAETALEREEQERRRSRRAGYQLDEAALLEALGRAEEARALYRAVREEVPRTSEGRRAAAALERMGE